MPYLILSLVTPPGKHILGRDRTSGHPASATKRVSVPDNDTACNSEATVQLFALEVPSSVLIGVDVHYREWSLNLPQRPGNYPGLHLLEPSPNDAIRAYVPLQDQAPKHQLAMWDKPGARMLHTAHEGAILNSVVAVVDLDHCFETTRSGTFTTVTVSFVRTSLRNVRLVKVDSEGHDLAVARGFEVLLQPESIDLVQLEYNLRWQDSISFLLDTSETVQHHGYSADKAVPLGNAVSAPWQPRHEKFVENNCLTSARPGAKSHYRPALGSVA